DGQTTITANIPFGSNKITGLGAGTAATDAANLSQVQSTVAKLVTVTGTDTITGSMSPQLTAYAAGQLFYFVANAANTGPVTINIDSLGAKAITRDGSTALAAGDINSGEVVVVIYDGTRFQMINAANSFGNTTINGTLTVTGNTGLQANVSITSTLSVGGTFAVTGAATLGSTLAVTGKSDLPTVSTASINAAVALITTGTVTNLTASGASIASANIGNLQFTAASIASINAGVAVITNLTATGASIASANVGNAVITAATVTGASIASANVGTAVITTGTVTNLTSTSASVASINAAVALITTGTVTALTATGASVASANVGTAVVTGLTVTNASIASLNAGTATVTTGNLTFSSTAQRITGDFSNATVANRLMFQGSTTNATTFVGLIPNGTGTTSSINCFGVNDPTNASFIRLLQNGTSDSQIRSDITGTGSYVPMIFYTGGSERMRLDTSGNLGIATASPFTTLDVNGYFMAGVRNTTNISLTSGTHYFGSSPSDLLRNNIVGNINTDSTTPVRLRFYKSRGTSASPTAVSSGDQTNDIQTYAYDGSSFIQATSIQAVVTATPSTNNVSSALSFSTNGGSSSPTERMRISSDGSVGIGGTANANAKAEVLGTLPSSSGASRGVIVSGTFPSGATASANAFTSFPSTEAASFTASILRHFFASQGTIGAGSAVTSQFGFAVNSNLTGATNNYGFYSDIASGSNRWNFYAAGTANNYFAGSVGIGTTSIGVPLDVGAGSGSVSIRINGASSGNGNGANIYFSNASVVVGTLGNPSVLSGGAFDNSIALTGYYGLRFDTTGTERMRITSTGNVVAGGSVALATTATDGFLYVPTCAGTPTGTPTAITGMAPIVVNTTNNKLYFYSGGAWRDAGP
ncbi:MAG: hypothetical protein EBR82_31350, partial [Caulobacteraceae bacterium]|nr:hypothetical protein [Caulobacteraceae bacterium]